MSRGMVSFLAGFGGGYIKSKDKAYERERQAKEDAWRDEQRGWQKSDRASAEADKQALKDATAERTTMQGTAVTDGAGNANLYKDPTQAATMADEARIEAEMRGQSPDTVMTAPATGITGAMSKGSQITSGPVDVAALNSKDAKFGRVADALMARGKPIEALGMENAVMDSKAKKIGLDTAQMKFADEMFNRQMGEALSSSPNWYEGAADLLTKTSVGGLKGVTIKPVLSEDGKTVNMTAVGADGAEKVVKSFKAGAEGQQEFMQAVAKVDPVTKIGWMAERAKTEYQQGRDKKADDQWQQTFDFSRKKEENDQQYRTRVLALQGAQEARAQAVHKIAMEDAKIPPAVKMTGQALSDQIKSVDSALNKAMAEGMFKQDDPGVQKLMAQRAVLSSKYQTLLAPYIPSAAGAKPTTDPLGLNSGDKPEAAPAAAPPQGAGALPNANGAAGVPTRPAAAAPAAPMQTATAPAPAPAAPAPAPRMTLAQVLAGPSADPALQKAAAARAQQMESAAAELRNAQAGVAAAAQRGDQKAVATAMQSAAAAGARLNAFTKDMNEQQAAQARAALGL